MVEYHKTHIESEEESILNNIRMFYGRAFPIVKQGHCDGKMIVIDSETFGFLHPMTPTAEDASYEKVKYRYSKFRMLDPTEIAHGTCSIHEDGDYKYIVPAIFQNIPRIVTIWAAWHSLWTRVVDKSRDTLGSLLYSPPLVPLEGTEYPTHEDVIEFD